MKRITAEGVNFLYFDRESLIDFHTLKLNAEVQGEYIIDEFAKFHMTQDNDFRLSAFRLPPSRWGGSTVYLLYYLYWVSHPQNLDLLDTKVSRGQHTDVDFEFAIKTTATNVICKQCHSIWSTLTFADADPYFDNLDLFSRKVMMAPWLTCPTCETPFRLQVVKIFNQCNMSWK
ncbi:MAG: hypothetical protein L0154_16905 [Chloroflexi bacterium]|nr:hypothetical protein [Chloroflexota bacterium]